jgi:K+-transporting ATPase A subunit
VLYAYTSNVNSNGSAMAGLSGNTPFYNLTMTAATFIGRYLPIAFVLALAGHLARQRQGAVTVGTLCTYGANFVALATGAALILALLNFLPALSLGTLADGLG